MVRGGSAGSGRLHRRAGHCAEFPRGMAEGKSEFAPFFPPASFEKHEYIRKCLSRSAEHASSSPSAQESLFGRAKTPAERLRQHQRSLQKAQRELERERTKLEQQEKKLISDIKVSARKGQIVSSP